VTIAVCVLLIRFLEILERIPDTDLSGFIFTAIWPGLRCHPNPCFALTFTLGSRFDPFLIGMIAATGAAIGAMLVYFTAVPASILCRISISPTRQINLLQRNWSFSAPD